MTASERLTWGLLLAAAVVATLSIVYLPVEPWDEARRGVNALEMLRNGDYLNYRYLGEPDTFNTKPPLFTWLVAVSFRLFGVNAVALRLPSLLALLTFLLYFRHWLAGRFDPTTVLLTLTACVVTKGLLGYHVGISGDTDMLFVLFLTVAGLAYYAFLVDRKPAGLLLAVGAGGLAFLTKGVAVGLVVPGMVVFTFAYAAGRRRLFSRAAVSGLLIGVVVFGGVLLALTALGRDTFPAGGPDNLLEAMFFRDGLQRLTDPDFEPGAQPWYVFQALDIRFGPLIYALYAAVPWLVWKLGARAILRRVEEVPFVLFSVCITASILLLLHFSSNKHNWYVAPAIPYLAYLFARAVRCVPVRARVYRWLAAGLVCLSLFTRLVDIRRADLPELPAPLAERISQAETLYIDRYLPQDYVFLLCAGAQEKVNLQTSDKLPKEERGECFSLDGHTVCIK